MIPAKPVNQREIMGAALAHTSDGWSSGFLILLFDAMRRDPHNLQLHSRASTPNYLIFELRDTLTDSKAPGRAR